MLFVLFLLFAAFLFYHMYWKRRRLPPGPLPKPIIGNLDMILKYTEPGYDMYIGLKKQYGSVYSFTFANLDAVIVADWELIKETFIKDGNSYVGRPTFPISDMIRGGKYGVVETIGHRWIMHRRFILQFLRDFGMGRSLMEERVLAEVHNMKKVLNNDYKDGPIDLQDYIDIGVGSIINSLLFGYRYDESRKGEFLIMKKSLTQHMRIAGEPAGMFLAMWPLLKYLPFFNSKYQVIQSNVDKMFALFDEQIRVHQKNIDYDSQDSTDITEAYLKEMKKREDEPDFGGFELIQLKSICFDLWIAGMETTSNTIYWAVLYILHNPEVARKMRAELDMIVGNDRTVTMDDKSKLHYINAVINEVQRLANLLPNNLMHKTVNDVVINGYRIPEDTIIIPQISSVMYDEKLFPEPYKFKPERHLDENGHLKKIEELSPFSIGKRQCLGEGLARMELFLFIANLYNQFEILPVDQANLPTTKKSWGITMCAQKFQVNLKPRFIEL